VPAGYGNPPEANLSTRPNLSSRRVIADERGLYWSGQSTGLKFNLPIRAARQEQSRREKTLLPIRTSPQLFLGDDFPSSLLLTELDGSPGFYDAPSLSSSCSRACSLDGLETRLQGKRRKIQDALSARSFPLSCAARVSTSRQMYETFTRYAPRVHLRKQVSRLRSFGFSYAPPHQRALAYTRVSGPKCVYAAGSESRVSALVFSRRFFTNARK